MTSSSSFFFQFQLRLLTLQFRKIRVLKYAVKLSKRVVGNIGVIVRHLFIFKCKLSCGTRCLRTISAWPKKFLCFQSQSGEKVATGKIIIFIFILFMTFRVTIHNSSQKNKVRHWIVPTRTTCKVKILQHNRLDASSFIWVILRKQTKQDNVQVSLSNAYSEVCITEISQQLCKVDQSD